jgi:hypothetical protein
MNHRVNHVVLRSTRLLFTQPLERLLIDNLVTVWC